MSGTVSNTALRVDFRLNALAAGLCAALGLPAAGAMGYNVPPMPAIGTTTVATADLDVTRPSTTPCKVTLFSNVDFIGFTPTPIAYTPPTGCPGPWAKVVLTADYNVTAGIQYDRTAVINLDGVNLYFGTTMEPDPVTARAWHVERDLTDLSALFMAPQAGQAILGNIVDSTYTGQIYGTAHLLFYPTAPGVPAKAAPQVVVPLASSLTALSPSNPTLSASVTLPQNTERLFLDVIAQSQANDEFWYTCVPDALAGELQSCGGGAFREVEVLVDGTPAGSAPVFPWIYSGGISPYLWTPSPGVQTLNFKPSRIDLTPFAGQLDDGQPHTVAVQVFGAQDNFSVTGSLLAYTDAHAQVLTGSVTQNTMALPVVNVADNGLISKGNDVHGKVFVTSSNSYTISGTLNTSHGPVTTTVAQTMSFRNGQTFKIGLARYTQNIDQETTVETTVTTVKESGTHVQTTHDHYPLKVDLTEWLYGDNIVLDTAIKQDRDVVVRNIEPDGTKWAQHSNDRVEPKAKTIFNQTTGGATVQGMTSKQRVRQYDTRMGCYERTITVVAGAVSAVSDGCTTDH